MYRFSDLIAHFNDNKEVKTALEDIKAKPVYPNHPLNCTYPTLSAVLFWSFPWSEHQKEGIDWTKLHQDLNKYELATKSVDIGE